MRLILLDRNDAQLLFGIEDEGPLVALCQGHLDIKEDIEAFRNSAATCRSSFPLATLQRGHSSWSKSLTKHDLYAIHMQLQQTRTLTPFPTVIVPLTTVFPLSNLLSHFVRKPRFNLHRNCVTNSIYTRTRMAIVDCVERVLNVGYERIWFSEIRV